MDHIIWAKPRSIVVNFDWKTRDIEKKLCIRSVTGS